MRPEPDFAELYRIHHRHVRQLCRQLLHSSEDAEDAAQEVFLRARQHFNQFDAVRSFGHWIRGIASHHCIDRLRQRGSERRLFGSEDVERVAAASKHLDPLNALIVEERAGELRRGIAALPVKYRVPVVLAYYAELPYEEIAGLLGLQRSHVAVLVFRGRQQLRQALKAPHRKRQ